MVNKKYTLVYFGILWYTLSIAIVSGVTIGDTSKSGAVIVGKTPLTGNTYYNNTYINQTIINGTGGNASTPGGQNLSIQFNNASSFSGDRNLTYNDTSKTFKTFITDALNYINSEEYNILFNQPVNLRNYQLASSKINTMKQGIGYDYENVIPLRQGMNPIAINPKSNLTKRDINVTVGGDNPYTGGCFPAMIGYSGDVPYKIGKIIYTNSSGTCIVGKTCGNRVYFASLESNTGAIGRNLTSLQPNTAYYFFNSNSETGNITFSKITGSDTSYGTSYQNLQFENALTGEIKTSFSDAVSNSWIQNEIWHYGYSEIGEACGFLRAVVGDFSNLEPWKGYLINARLANINMISNWSNSTGKTFGGDGFYYDNVTVLDSILTNNIRYVNGSTYSLSGGSPSFDNITADTINASRIIARNLLSTVNISLTSRTNDIRIVNESLTALRIIEDIDSKALVAFDTINNRTLFNPNYRGDLGLNNEVITLGRSSSGGGSAYIYFVDDGGKKHARLGTFGGTTIPSFAIDVNKNNTGLSPSGDHAFVISADVTNNEKVYIDFGSSNGGHKATSRFWKYDNTGGFNELFQVNNPSNIEHSRSSFSYYFQGSGSTGQHNTVLLSARRNSPRNANNFSNATADFDIIMKSPINNSFITRLHVGASGGININSPLGSSILTLNGQSNEQLTGATSVNNSTTVNCANDCNYFYELAPGDKIFLSTNVSKVVNVVSVPLNSQFIVDSPIGDGNYALVNRTKQLMSIYNKTSALKYYMTDLGDVFIGEKINITLANNITHKLNVYGNISVNDNVGLTFVQVFNATCNWTVTSGLVTGRSGGC